MADFSQQPGEGTAEWLARLKAVTLSGLSGADRRSLLGAEQVARGQASQERRDAGAEAARQTALGQARAAYLMLAPGERQQFILWLAQGAPEGASEEAEGVSRPGG